MTAWSRIPLRLRVALAFAVCTAVALAALGVVLHLRVASTLEEQTLAALEARTDGLASLSSARRRDAVRVLSEDSFGQVLGRDGAVLASSSQLRDPLLAVDHLPAPGEVVTVDGRAFLTTEGERTPATLRAVGVGEEVLVVGIATDDVAEVLAGLRAQLGVGGALVLVLASGLGYVIAGAALRPMEQMRARAATISARSSGERLPLPEARDEVRRLGSTLNDMLDRLDAGLRRERRFVAEASHELRTPLALLRTELDLAGSRERSPEELAAFLASATEEVDRLSSLVDHLLVLARADDAGLELELERIHVPALLERVAARYSRGGHDGRIEVLPGEDVAVVGDRTRLDQAVTNLVDNALQHGTGTVTLGVRRRDGRVRVSVSDQGGVLLDRQLLDRFRRGDGPRSGGRGLGLSLVAAIAAEHGGSVRFGVEHTRTTVTLELPG